MCHRHMVIFMGTLNLFLYCKFHSMCQFNSSTAHRLVSRITVRLIDIDEVSNLFFMPNIEASIC